MINAWEILETLGKHLDHTVELTLYGRAALAVGFESHLTCHDTTKDVDAIIPLAQLESLRHDNQFWDALDKTNEDLQSRGLYITHTFSEMVSRFALIGFSTASSFQKSSSIFLFTAHQQSISS